MLALNLAHQPSSLQAPWPANALFGIDFSTGRATRLGANIPLSQAMSFTRSSARLARTRSGLWRSFAAGEPAMTDMGISLEPESTNLVVYNTGNSGSGMLLTGTTVAAIGADDSPARDAHGKRVTQGSGGSDGLTRHTLNVTGGQTYSWSQSFKYDGSATWIRFTFSDNVAHGINIWLNLQTMTLGTVGVFGSAVLSAFGLTPEINGWARLHMTGTVPNNAVGGLSTYVCSTNGSSTRAAGSYGLWGTQKDAGPQTSVILTSGTAGTRLADSAGILLSGGSQTVHLLDSGGNISTAATPGGLTNLVATAGSKPVHAAWTHPA